MTVTTVQAKPYASYHSVHLYRGVQDEHQELLSKSYNFGELVRIGNVKSKAKVKEGCRLQALMEPAQTTVTIEMVTQSNEGYYVVEARVGSTHLSRAVNVGDTYTFIYVPNDSLYLVVDAE